ncbi:MAG: hypothetical protein K8R23_20580 [Chthoniobacter sp.]|nr:hypothetical protein [Chthoniobacter sp.]
MAQIVSSNADLAPGDLKSAALDLSSFQIDRIRTANDPLFGIAYAALWAEFGAKDEMELRETLAQRFGLAPRMLYEMILVRRGGEFVAVRDHTAAVADGAAVVHLSHNLVAPHERRTGIAGWLRAWPIQAARECLATQGLPADAPVTLLAEMELDRPDDEARAIRLKAYERGGFRKIAHAVVPYHQPDFRAFAAIDATGGARPLPFQLVVRRVGKEGEHTISGREVRGLVRALYAIYAPQFRPADLAHPLLAPDRLPPDDAVIPLLPPTQC